MMRYWIRRLGSLLLSLILLIFIIGLFLPVDYHVNRSIVINAAPETIHTFVGDLKKWDLWAPWKEEDPSIVTTYGTQTVGVGAQQSWTGKDGDGSLTFTKSSPDQGIEYDLFFGQGRNTCWAAMLYTPIGESTTTVEWQMKGKMDTPIIGGYFAMMMDAMVGNMFERGLIKLKGVAEATT